jgi:hypothetical protein
MILDRMPALFLDPTQIPERPQLFVTAEIVGFCHTASPDRRAVGRKGLRFSLDLDRAKTTVLVHRLAKGICQASPFPPLLLCCSSGGARVMMRWQVGIPLTQPTPVDSGWHDFPRHTEFASPRIPRGLIFAPFFE